jgi:hypothetical protein
VVVEVVVIHHQRELLEQEAAAVPVEFFTQRQSPFLVQLLFWQVQLVLAQHQIQQMEHQVVIAHLEHSKLAVEVMETVGISPLLKPLALDVVEQIMFLADLEVADVQEVRGITTQNLVELVEPSRQVELHFLEILILVQLAFLEMMLGPEI